MKTWHMYFVKKLQTPALGGDGHVLCTRYEYNNTHVSGKVVLPGATSQITVGFIQLLLQVCEALPKQLLSNIII